VNGAAYHIGLGEQNIETLINCLLTQDWLHERGQHLVPVQVRFTHNRPSKTHAEIKSWFLAVLLLMAVDAAAEGSALRDHAQHRKTRAGSGWST
jgi:hypothetical protein